VQGEQRCTSPAATNNANEQVTDVQPAVRSRCPSDDSTLSSSSAAAGAAAAGLDLNVLQPSSQHIKAQQLMGHVALVHTAKRSLLQRLKTGVRNMFKTGSSNGMNKASDVKNIHQHYCCREGLEGKMIPGCFWR
jgi:hypothetical protein